MNDRIKIWEVLNTFLTLMSFWDEGHVLHFPNFDTGISFYPWFRMVQISHERNDREKKQRRLEILMSTIKCFLSIATYFNNFFGQFIVSFCVITIAVDNISEKFGIRILSFKTMYFYFFRIKPFGFHPKNFLLKFIKI